MSTRPPMVGLVATIRSLAVLTLLVGLVSALPALLRGTEGLGVPGTVLLAALIFGLPFAWFAGPRRVWYQTRLDAVTPLPHGATVVAREKTFELVSRPLTVPLVIALGLCLLIAYNTGIPAGLALVGVGGGLLLQARWLAREERRRGVWLLCPQAPLRVAADDPALSLYRRAPFYTAPEPPTPDLVS
ncbi:hypothetical protein [Streptomyces sp. NPDC102437]|uniref:hypothetical protein n=1 Tax=Streptomyces sp. NPDC102437 TaxID=3366175 RepID=UPI0038248F13